MASLLGATCGLFAFSAMIVRGLMAGNAVDVILLRSIGGLFGFFLFGSIAGWVVQRVLDDRAMSAESTKDDDGARVELDSAATVRAK